MTNTAGYLLVIPWELDAIGGVNQVVVNLYDEMEADKTFRPYIFISAWDVPSPKERIEGGRRIVRGRLRPIFDKTRPIWAAISILVRAPFEMYRLRHFLRQHNIKVVNAHFPGHSTELFLLMKRLGVLNAKLVLSLHGSDIRNALTTSGYERRCLRLLYAHSDMLVACSNGLAKRVKEFVSDAAQNVTTIYNGIDTRKLVATQDASFNLPRALANRDIVLSVGAFDRQKGQDVLIRAIPDVIKNHDQVLFVLIGRPGSNLNSVRRLIHENALDQYVHIIEGLPHAKVLAILNIARIFVLPSRQEAFSVALLEAGAYSLPVVATDVCGVSELITNNENGLIVPSEDHVSLGKSINKLLNEKSLADQLGHRLNERVTTQFTLSNTCAAYRSQALKLLTRSPII